MTPSVALLLDNVFAPGSGDLPYVPGATIPPRKDTRTLGDMTDDELRNVLTQMNADVNGDIFDDEDEHDSAAADPYEGWRGDLLASLGSPEESISGLGAYWTLADKAMNARGCFNKGRVRRIGESPAVPGVMTWERRLMRRADTLNKRAERIMAGNTPDKVKRAELLKAQAKKLLSVANAGN